MNYMKVVPCDIANGPGVRVTLFCAGCNHHCPGCQNPTTWDPNGGQPFTDEMLDKIVDLLRPDYIQGLTLTGGDPLLPENLSMILRIVLWVKIYFAGKKDIWMWTGYTWEELIDRIKSDFKKGDFSETWEILGETNVLVDGPFIESKKDISLPYMGSSNQRVIDTWKSLMVKHKPTLWWTPEEKGK